MHFDNYSPFINNQMKFIRLEKENNNTQLQI